jgi:hypothetical protein
MKFFLSIEKYNLSAFDTKHRSAVPLFGRKLRASI